MAKLHVREAARVIALDNDNRILLLRYEDHGRIFWATPGGRIEPGETYETAALRELTEELGINNVEVGAQLAQRAVDHEVGTETVRQIERYFVARISTHEIDIERATQSDSISCYQWWTVDDLRASNEVVYPADLASLVGCFLVDGPPENPLSIP